MSTFGQSGFEKSSEKNPNFEFSSPATVKLAPNNPTCSSISSVSRPRMGKSRKSVNSRLMGSSETRKADPGFNPFRPISDNLTGVPSKLDTDVHGDFGSKGFVDDGDVASINRTKHLNLKPSNEVEKLGNALISEIRELKIENEADCHVAKQTANYVNGWGSASLSGIQQSSKGVDDSLPSDLGDELKRLNLGDSCSEHSKVSQVPCDGFHGGHNVGGLSGTTLTSELPDDLKTSNLEDTSVVGSRSFVFGATGKSDFVFGSNRKNDGSITLGIASTLPHRIGSLNIEDSDKSNGAQKEMNVNKGNWTFDLLNRGSTTDRGGVIGTMILDDMEKLKIGGGSEGSGDHGDLDSFQSLRNEPHVNMSKEDTKKLNQTEFDSQVRGQGKLFSGPQVPEDPTNKGSGLQGTSASSTSSFEFHVPCMDGAEKKAGFDFIYKQTGLEMRMPHVEFKTPDPKGNLFTGSNQKMEFSAKKGSVRDAKLRGRKGKLKEHTPTQMSLGKNFVLRENNFLYVSEPSESYPPMKVSSYEETKDDEQADIEPSLTCDNQMSTDLQTAFSHDATYEDLVTETKHMGINEGHDMKHDEVKVQVTESSVDSCVALAGSLEDSVSAVATEGFKSGFGNLNMNREDDDESNSEAQSCDQTQYLSASSPGSSGGSSFNFSAFSSAQGQASATMHQHRKKNRTKAVLGNYNPARTASSLEFSPISRDPAFPSQMEQKDGISTVPHKGVINLKVLSPASKTSRGSDLEGSNKENTSPAAAGRAAQEACEKWRLRGNQAYANGDLEKAEDYYTQGLSCIPRNETSKDCLRALLLCYSNRAAASVSRGRIREALQDCLIAIEMDPNFFRVQLRAANCYLALGEVGDASLYFRKLLQSSDVCVERKLIVDASDGLLKAQRVSECMDHSSELLLQRTSATAESALGVIAEALVISPYSEKLLESKAEALFLLRRYEEVILLCEQTLEAAETNSVLVDTNGQSSNLDASEILKN